MKDTSSFAQFPTNQQPTNPFPSATAPPIVNIAPTDSPADPTPQSSHPHKSPEIGNPHDNAGSRQ